MGGGGQPPGWEHVFVLSGIEEFLFDDFSRFSSFVSSPTHLVIFMSKVLLLSIVLKIFGND